MDQHDRIDRVIRAAEDLGNLDLGKGGVVLLGFVVMYLRRIRGQAPMFARHPAYREPEPMYLGMVRSKE